MTGEFLFGQQKFPRLYSSAICHSFHQPGGGQAGARKLRQERGKEKSGDILRKGPDNKDNRKKYFFKERKIKLREQVIAKRKDGNRSEKYRRIKRKAGKEEGSIVKKEDKRDERKNEN